MQTIVVYDTATERNPVVLRTCRKYLRWTQRSVFQGELTPAQLRALENELRRVIDPSADSVIVFAIAEGASVQRRTMGLDLALNDTII